MSRVLNVVSVRVLKQSKPEGGKGCPISLQQTILDRNTQRHSDTKLCVKAAGSVRRPHSNHTHHIHTQTLIEATLLKIVGFDFVYWTVKCTLLVCEATVSYVLLPVLFIEVFHRCTVYASFFMPLR